MSIKSVATLAIVLCTFNGCQNEAAQPQVQVLRDGTPFDCEAEPDSCALMGGSELVRVRATYTGLAFDANNHPKRPTVAVLVDGVADASPPQMVNVTDAGDLVFESEPYRIPASNASALSFRVTGADGYTGEADGFSVTVAPPIVRLSGCGDNCSEFPAGVGEATMEVDAWVPADAKLTVHTRLDNVPSSAPLETTFSGSDDMPRRAVIAIAVPNVFVAPGDSLQWTLEPAIFGSSLPLQQLTLIPPSVMAEIEQCADDDPCVLAADSQVNLRVSVPSGFSDVVATVRTFVDNVALAGPFEVDLNLLEGNTLVGVAPLTMPAQADAELVARVYVGDGFVRQATARTPLM